MSKVAQKNLLLHARKGCLCVECKTNDDISITPLPLDSRGSEKKRVFTTMFNVGEAVDGYGTLLRLADSPAHVVPGHDPLVMQRYPAASAALQGIVASLHESPTQADGAA